MASVYSVNSDSEIEFDVQSDTKDDDQPTLIFTEDDVLPTWKRMFHLPFEPVWANLLLLFAYIQVCLSIYNAGFETYSEGERKIRASNFDDAFRYGIDVMYVIDIFFIIACNNIQGLIMDPARIHYPCWVLVMDLLSLVPMEKLVPVNTLSQFRRKLYYIVQLNDCLKLGRIYNVFHHYYNVIGNFRLYLRLVEYCLNMMLVTLIGVCVTYNAICNYSECTDPLSFTEHIEFVYISLCRLTARGFAHYPNNLLWMLCFTFMGYMVYWCIIYNTLSYVIIAMFMRYYHRYRFLQKQYLIQKVLKDFNVSKRLSDRCLTFLGNFWKKRNGYHSTLDYIAILPPVLCEEVALDACWFTLKHSKLFRDMELPFLRYVSKFVQPRFLHPGEIIYEKQAMKDVMVYIISGVIQILSEEDDETPLLSFSGGTCFGEVSLLLGNESKATVRCKTYCSLQILERKDIIKLIAVFPEQYVVLRRNFMRRLAEAKEFWHITKIIHSNRGQEDRTDKLTIMWLKSTLHRLMIRHGETSRKHECPNIFLRSEFNERKFINEHFTATSLDMLAISERLELVTDAVFLKTSCPCILQPDSIILNGWNVIITILALNIAFMVPYFAFVEPSIPDWYTAGLYMTTVFWWIDLYVQVSVGVKTPDGIIATVRSIFIHRMSTPAFLAELFAALPLEMLSCILLPKVTGQTRAILELNRVIKLSKIHSAIYRWENKLHYNSIFICYIKYGFGATYLIFIFSCLLYACNCFDFTCSQPVSPKGQAMEMIWHALSATQILTGAGMSIYYSHKQIYYPVYMVLTITSSLLYILIYGSISAIKALAHLNRIRIKEMLTDITRITTVNGIADKYNRRIFDYVETQWMDNRGSKLLNSQPIFTNVPMEIYGAIWEEINADTLLAVPLFQNFPEGVIAELCLIGSNTIIPANEVICYSGEISDTFYVVHMGYCKIESSTITISERIIGPRDSISIIETWMRVPVTNTVIAITDCRLVTISYTGLISALVKYPIYMNELKATFKEFDQQFSILFRSNQFNANYGVLAKRERSRSLFKFGYNLKVDSFEEYDYYIPFDRLDLFSFVRFFLFRFTILPESKFLRWWEVLRCICAFFSAILFPINRLGTCTHCPWFFILIFLDIMAWIDIYMRLHVGYYNQHGILVTHPLRTATHYLTHAFLMDVVSVFPVQVFVSEVGVRRNRWLSLFQLNRVLQMSRYIGHLNYYIKTNMLPSRSLFVYKLFPILIILCSSVGSAIINLRCIFGKEVKNPPGSPFTDGVRCKPHMWIVQSDFTKPLTPSRVQLYGVYFITSIITQAGMLGSTIEADTTAFTGTILAIVGYIFILYIVSKTISQYTSQDSTLLAYQGFMVSIRNYMHSYNVNLDLQKQLIQHHELKWNLKRGKDIHVSISRFNQSLQQDILYDVYGTVLESTWPFIAGSKPFLRSLLLEMSHEIIMKNGFISTKNDVNKHLHILYKGTARVIAADGTQLCTLLPGSMFGNLEDCKFARQTVSITSACHVEILTIETLQFHKILSSYPRLQSRFKFLTRMHTDYLEGRSTDATVSLGSSVSKKSTSGKFRSAMRGKAFNPESTLIKIWQFCILIFVCYIGICLDLFQMAMSTYHVGVIVYQYLCDVLYIIDFYIQCHTAYENEAGMMVTNLKMIRHRLFQNKTMFWITILSLVPFDVIAWPFSYSTFRYVYSVLRFNRLLRFNQIIQYITKVEEKLDINLYVMQSIYIALTSTFILHLCTCFLIAISCNHIPNMHPVIICGSTSFFNGLKMYVRYFFVVAGIFMRSSQSLSYPESAYMIAYIIFIMFWLGLTATFFLAEIYTSLQMACHRINRFTRYLEKIEIFMLQQNISSALQAKVRSYCKLIWRYQRGTTVPTLLVEAPPYLREAILNSAFSYLINGHFIFEKCHVDFNRQVVACMTNTTYFRGDYIVFKGTINNCMYFIHSGAVTILEEDHTFNETVVGHLTDGNSFGISQGLFFRKPYTHSFRALNPTIIFTLDMNMWKHLLDFYPASKRVIFERHANYEESYQESENP